MKGIMIQGCTSDAGKSYVATALCRIFADMGYKTCPYKSQNMSNNSYVTWDGCEIGRAQGVQAEAAGIRPETYMNPILLKPQKDSGSEIVLFGKVHKTLSGKEYHDDFTMNQGLEAARQGLKIIEENYDIVVIEGAGSPAEVNLNDREIVNMRIAKEADVPVLLVVDINRGGSFASVVGTLELVGEDRKRIKGIIFNQFRGDIALFEDGVRWIEEYTGVKVVGVLPYFKDIHIEGEDSLSIKFQHTSGAKNAVSLGIVKLPYISNHTDMEIFQYEDDINISFIDEFSSLDKYDAIIIPGTKSTIGDLEYLEERGIAKKLQDYNGTIFGICGGYQIMGETLIDEEGVDFKPGYKKSALGLLPLTTYFQRQKEVGQVKAMGLHPAVKGIEVNGYEIHLGRTDKLNDSITPLWDINGRWDGVATKDLKRGGSYLHNIFHNDNFRNIWLNAIRRRKGLPEREMVDTIAYKESQYKKLAEAAKEHLDMDYIMKLVQEG
ncbi:MAG: cobyric acid synthase [Bacillota bacterium]|nr:cobyric acid synthase [Bacillota bacterium]